MRRVAAALLGAAAAAALAPAQQPSSPFSISDFGAIAGVDSHAQALANGAAFARALAAANASAAAERRGVLVPPGVFSFLPAAPSFDGVANLTIFLEGTLNVSTANLTLYPGMPESPWSPLGFRGCSAMRIVSQTGRGLVNGRGNGWWWATSECGRVIWGSRGRPRPWCLCILVTPRPRLRQPLTCLPFLPPHSAQS